MKKQHSKYFPKPKSAKHELFIDLVNDFNDLRLQNDKNQSMEQYFVHQNPTICSTLRTKQQHNQNMINQISYNKNRLSSDFFKPNIKNVFTTTATSLKPNKYTSNHSQNEYQYTSTNLQIAQHIIKLFQKKSGHRLFSSLDAEKKGYLNETQVNKIIDNMGYEKLSANNRQKVYIKCIQVCTATKDYSPNNRILTYSHLRSADAYAAVNNKSTYTPKIYTNYDKILMKKYNPLIEQQLHMKSDPTHFQFKSNYKQIAEHVIHKLQERYSKIRKPYEKLICWDIDKDGEISKKEMHDMLLLKMNMKIDDEVLDEMFNIFKKNELQNIAKNLNLKAFSKHAQSHALENLESISFSIFVQTIMKHNFSTKDIDKNPMILNSPLSANKISKKFKFDKLVSDEELFIIQKLKNRIQLKFQSLHLTKDIFQYLNKNSSKTFHGIYHMQFGKGLKSIDPQLTNEEISIIIKVMDKENTGYINYRRFAQFFNQPINDRRILWNNFDSKKSGIVDEDDNCSVSNIQSQEHLPIGKRNTLNIFDVDRKSDYYESSKNRFNQKLPNNVKYSKGKRHRNI